MKEKTLQSLLDKIRKYPKIEKLLIYGGKISTLFVYGYYPLFLAFAYLLKGERDLRYIIVPAVSFVLLSFVRKLINAKRPYEKYDIMPLYKKSTKGCSFPSRHTFSAFIIGYTILMFNPYLAISVFVAGVIMAICRVLCGIHFIKDVLAGAVSAIACGIIGFII